MTEGEKINLNDWQQIMTTYKISENTDNVERADIVVSAVTLSHHYYRHSVQSSKKS